MPLDTLLKLNTDFRALEALMEAILEKSGITPEDGNKGTLGEKLKRWFRQFSFVELEKETIEGYGKKLTNAMDQFRVRILPLDVAPLNKLHSSRSRFSWASRCNISRAR
jgi:hypothetical protein